MLTLSKEKMHEVPQVFKAQNCQQFNTEYEKWRRSTVSNVFREDGQGREVGVSATLSLLPHRSV